MTIARVLSRSPDVSMVRVAVARFPLDQSRLGRDPLVGVAGRRAPVDQTASLIRPDRT